MTCSKTSSNVMTGPPFGSLSPPQPGPSEGSCRRVSAQEGQLLRHPPLHFYQGMPAKKDFVVPEFAALELLGEQVRGHPELLLEGAQLCRKIFQVLAAPVGGIIKELGDGLVADGILSSKLRQLSQGFELFFKANLVPHALLALQYNHLRRR